jgi:hypothetical protein
MGDLAASTQMTGEQLFLEILVDLLGFRDLLDRPSLHTNSLFPHLHYHNDQANISMGQLTIAMKMPRCSSS